MGSEAKSRFSTRFWFILAALAGITCHMLFGLTAVLARLLQNGTTPIPTFMLLFLSNFFSFIIYLPLGSWRFYKLDDPKAEVIAYFKNWVVYAFAASMTIASMCKMLASRYTSAVFAQLTLQMSPFVVTLMSFFILKEMITKITVICLIFTVGGGILVLIAGSSTGNGETWKMNWLINFSHFSTDFSWWDLIGIGFGLGSAFFLGVFTVSIKWATSKSKKKIDKMSLLGLGLVTMITVYLGCSLAFRENWGVLLICGWKEWIYLVAYILTTSAGLYLEMFAIPIIGASWFSSVLSMRLVVTVCTSWPLLGEQMDNFWQFVGCAIVIIGVSLFLIYGAWNESMKKTERHVKLENPTDNGDKAQEEAPQATPQVEVSVITETKIPDFPEDSQNVNPAKEELL